MTPPPTITTDENMKVGYMLADDAPTDPDERIALFAALAREEWDLDLDPAHLHSPGAAQRYKWDDDDDPEYAVPARRGEQATAGEWYVITGLRDAA